MGEAQQNRLSADQKGYRFDDHGLRPVADIQFDFGNRYEDTTAYATGSSNSPSLGSKEEKPLRHCLSTMVFRWENLLLLSRQAMSS
jgi:hypothetical protein